MIRLFIPFFWLGFCACAGEPPEDISEPPAETCELGPRTCKGNAVATCKPGGSGYGEPSPCPDGEVCNLGFCGPCQPDQLLCQGREIVRCLPGGGGVEPVDTCSAAEVCYLGACVGCVPGVRECREEAGAPGEAVAEEAWVCKVGDGGASWALAQVCDEGAECIGGLCVQPCQTDVKIDSTRGCDYYAVDLENSATPGASGTASAANSQFAVVVSNPSARHALEVTVRETPDGEPVAVRQLEPRALEVIPLGQRNVMGTRKAALAWRVEGSRPFVATQFNPLDNTEPAYSNDASLLLPVGAVGRDYLVLTGRGGGSFVTVVGTRPGTQVTIEVTASTFAGDGLDALAAGESLTATLDEGEVLNLSSAPSGTEDLSGTRVTATKDVMVFGGNRCTTSGELCCCDHLEQQLFPTSVWGRKTVLAAPQTRLAEHTHYRVIALEDDTTVTVGGEVRKLSSREVVNMTLDGDAVLESDKPVMVAQILASSFEVYGSDACAEGKDCDSGVCLGAGPNHAGLCGTACSLSANGCMKSEQCVDRRLITDASQSVGGGLCWPRQCQPGVLCGAGSACYDEDGDGHGVCLKSCASSASCEPSAECYQTGPPMGMVCGYSKCSSDGDCSGACVSGTCTSACQELTACALSQQSCIPATWHASGKSLCLDRGGCAQDSDCHAGFRCIEAGGSTSCEPLGDPALILMVPTEQYRREYVFLVPEGFVQDYVTVVAPKGAAVTLDGGVVPTDRWMVGAYGVARIPVPDGVHAVVSDEPVGVIVYGYDDDVSYGYPAGANMNELSPAGP